MSEFSRIRSKTICFPSGVMSKARFSLRAVKRAIGRVFLGWKLQEPEVVAADRKVDQARPVRQETKVLSSRSTPELRQFERRAIW